MTLTVVIPSLNEGDWFAALDLKDTHFHIAIHPAHRRHLHSMVGLDHFQYKVLHFSLSAAPRVFYKGQVCSGSTPMPLMLSCITLSRYLALQGTIILGNANSSLCAHPQ